MSAKQKQETAEEAGTIDSIVEQQPAVEETLPPEDGWLAISDEIKDGRVVQLTDDRVGFVNAQWHATRTYDMKQMKWIDTGFWKLAASSVTGATIFGLQKVSFIPIAYRPAG